MLERATEPKPEGLLRELRELAGQILKFSADEVNIKAPFYTLGFDSISLTRLANDINARLGSTLTPAIFFECEHLEALSAHLEARHAVPLRTEAQSERPLPAPASGSIGRIAIIGMAARLPGADNPTDFFDRLLAGHDMVTPLPLVRYRGNYRERFAAAGFAKHGGFLADVDRFDAAFFHISPVEAERMDPQQRLMLETVWHALDDAGYRPDELPGDTGVFVGVTGHDYASLLQAHDIEHDGFVATGNSLAMVANRVSHHLDVHGPSQAVDTACSSSLVALLRAADAIRSGRCHAGDCRRCQPGIKPGGLRRPAPGGHAQPGRTLEDVLQLGRWLRPRRRRRRSVAEAAGGCRARWRPNSRIAGRRRREPRRSIGIADRAECQSAGRVGGARMAGIDPASIGYIEAHGTGTSLGDPVEINGLRLAYRALLAGARSPRRSSGWVR